MTSVDFLIFAAVALLPLGLFLYFFLNYSKRKKYNERFSHLTGLPTGKQTKSVAVSQVDINTFNPRLLAIIVLSSIAFVLKMLGFSLLMIIGIEGFTAFLLYKIPKVINERKSRALFYNLPACIDYITRSILAGNNVTTAFKLVNEAGLKASPLFSNIHQELAVGKPFQEVLKKASLTYKNKELSFCLSIFVTQHQTGRHEAGPLEHLAGLLRKKIAMQNTIAANTAETRLAAYILTCLPLLMVVYLMLVNPNYLKPLFNTALGHKLIAISIIMNILGLVVVSAMTKVKI